MAEKVYVIYDERAETQDTDEWAVLEACSSIEEVCQTTWDGKRDPLGVVFEYDLVERPGCKHAEALNERKLGTVPAVKAERIERRRGR